MFGRINKPLKGVTYSGENHVIDATQSSPEAAVSPALQEKGNEFLGNAMNIQEAQRNIFSFTQTQPSLKTEPTPRKRRYEPPQYQAAEIMYKAARPHKVPSSRISAGVLSAAGPDRYRTHDEKSYLRQHHHSKRHALIAVNPCAAVPMKARPWKPMTWLKYPRPQEEEWIKLEEQDKERRDCELALELGYETLVGNLQHIEIPGARDLNRSWKNYLSIDPMEWGFPYNKGEMESPDNIHSRQQPYLAHQVKERLWKYPRTKFLHTSDD